MQDLFWGMWTLSYNIWDPALLRDRTQGPWIGSAESQSLDPQGSPWTWHLLTSPVTLISCWKHPFMVQGQLKERAHSAGSTESAVFIFKSLSGKPAIFMEPQLDPKSPPRVSVLGSAWVSACPTHILFSNTPTTTPPDVVCLTLLWLLQVRWKLQHLISFCTDSWAFPEKGCYSGNKNKIWLAILSSNHKYLLFERPFLP